MSETSTETTGLGLYDSNHHSWGHRRYRIDYVQGEWWTEYATTPHEEIAKVIAGILLRTGRTVRISKTHECIELGVPVSPNSALCEGGKQSVDCNSKANPPIAAANG